jgi:osmotically-inducible protein OsmY
MQGTNDGLPGQINEPTARAASKAIMKYRATMKLFSAAGLTTLALLASSGAGAYEEPERAADQQLKRNVDTALSSDPYFYGAHVTTSVKNGSVVLRGFVFSDWDLRDAIRIATRAAGGRRVVDDLTIEVGGRR